MHDSRRTRLILGVLLAAALALITFDSWGGAAGAASPVAGLRGVGGTVFGVRREPGGRGDPAGGRLFRQRHRRAGLAAADRGAAARGHPAADGAEPGPAQQGPGGPAAAPAGPGRAGRLPDRRRERDRGQPRVQQLGHHRRRPRRRHQAGRDGAERGRAWSARSPRWPRAHRPCCSPRTRRPRSACGWPAPGRSGRSPGPAGPGPVPRCCGCRSSTRAPCSSRGSSWSRSARSTGGRTCPASRWE